MCSPPIIKSSSDYFGIFFAVQLRAFSKIGLMLENGN
jgi:hypothetical protein